MFVEHADGTLATIASDTFRGLGIKMYTRCETLTVACNKCLPAGSYSEHSNLPMYSTIQHFEGQLDGSVGTVMGLVDDVDRRDLQVAGVVVDMHRFPGEYGCSLMDGVLTFIDLLMKPHLRPSKKPLLAPTCEFHLPASKQVTEFFTNIRENDPDAAKSLEIRRIPLENSIIIESLKSPILEAFTKANNVYAYHSTLRRQLLVNINNRTKNKKGSGNACNQECYVVTLTR